MDHAGGRGKGGEGHGDHAADGNPCAAATKSRPDGHANGGAGVICKYDSPEARYLELLFRPEGEAGGIDAASEDYHNLRYNTKSGVRGKKKRVQTQVVKTYLEDDKDEGVEIHDGAGRSGEWK